MLEVSGGTACLYLSRYALSHFIGQGPYFQTLEHAPCLTSSTFRCLCFFLCSSDGLHRYQAECRYGEGSIMHTSSSAAQTRL